MTDDESASTAMAASESSEEPAVPSPRSQPIRWYRTSTNSLVVALRDAISVLLGLLVVVVVLVAISGLWTPVAIVQSDSMAPTLQEGDLVFLVEPDRYPGPGADEQGIVTRAVGQQAGHERFGQPGDVIVYSPNGRTDRPPIIHRAELRVQAGEPWYEEARSEWLGSTTRCVDAPPRLCPAPYRGYVTKGDANDQYDQSVDGGLPGDTTTVKPEWIRAKAVLRLRIGRCLALISGTDSCPVDIAR
jgi:signal peptidase